MAPNQGLMGAFFKEEKMVRSLGLVALLGLGPMFGDGVLAGPQKKRFIVRYKTQKVTASGALSNSIQSNIVKAESVSDIHRDFPLGDQNILSIEEDLILQPTVEPGDRGTEDTFYQSQWHYFEEDGGINLPSAWETTVGTSQVTVAVIDTGVLPHRELKDKLLPGADVITEVAMANDGDGRDQDATDSGDWVESGDNCYSGRDVNSTWHGTHVAGTIGAETANGVGVAGVAWGVRILPVRALGKCGGYVSDIADAIRWSAGGQVQGLNVNPNKADVINLSLGAKGSCGPTMQGAIDFAVSQGAVVVVAAGNSYSNMDLTSYVPASCRNVITVGAGNRFAGRSYYSNYGSAVDVMAPGGDFNGTVFSTSNDGARAPANDSYKGMMGTSMAAPHVAGVVALIKSVKPDLFPPQVEDILKRTTKFFSCYQEGGCGSGLIDAFAALEEALVTSPDSTFEGTEPITAAPPTPPENRVVTYEEESGGMCGSVAFVDGGPRPPQGGLGAFLVSLILGVGLGLMRKRSFRL